LISSSPTVGISNPGGTTTYKSDFASASDPHQAFIAYYVGSVSSLLPSFAGVISTDGGATFNALTAAANGVENALLKDLNYDSNPTDSNIEADAFVDRVTGKVFVVYGSGVSTDDQIIKK